MPGPTVLCRVRERGGLPLLLLVSAMIHLSLICFPYPGKVAGGIPAESAVRLAFRASVTSHAALVESAAREPARRARAPVPEPAQHVPDLSVNEQPGRASAVDRQPSPAFYEATALTIKPVALGEPALDAADAVSGQIVLSLWIDDQGTVVEVSVERSDLPADRLSAVADAFRVVRFAPGELNGQPVAAVMRIEVRYDDERLPIEP